MKVFWFWLAWSAAAWLLLAWRLPPAWMPAVVLGAALYLAGYFLMATAKGFAWQLLGRLLGLSVVVVLPWLPARAEVSWLLLAVGLLLGGFVVVDTLVRLTAPWAPALAGLGALLLLGTAAILLPPAAGVVLLPLAAAALAVLGLALRQAERERSEGAERYQALLADFRAMRRRAQGSEDAARAEERLIIARRLHDSVGHKLTGLLMQLESARLASERPASAGAGPPGPAAERTTPPPLPIEAFKRLAQQSLDETRRAVSALSEGEVVGMPALLRLVRNLEVESAMQVDFTVRQGALSVQLENERAVALYRVVQEALTNAMRHGANSRVEVLFEAPGARVFRFEVGNQLKPGAPAALQAGFGLSTMRQRVEAAGGALEAGAVGGRFLVRGSFPLSDGAAP